MNKNVIIGHVFNSKRKKAMLKAPFFRKLRMLDFRDYKKELFFPLKKGITF